VPSRQAQDDASLNHAFIGMVRIQACRPSHVPPKLGWDGVVIGLILTGQRIQTNRWIGFGFCFAVPGADWLACSPFGCLYLHRFKSLQPVQAAKSAPG
jgi:hypothetical protein